MIIAIRCVVTARFTESKARWAVAGFFIEVVGSIIAFFASQPQLVPSPPSRPPTPSSSFKFPHPSPLLADSTCPLPPPIAPCTPGSTPRSTETPPASPSARHCTVCCSLMTDCCCSCLMKTRCSSRSTSVGVQSCSILTAFCSVFCSLRSGCIWSSAARLS